MVRDMKTEGSEHSSPVAPSVRRWSQRQKVKSTFGGSLVMFTTNVTPPSGKSARFHILTKVHEMDQHPLLWLTVAFTLRSSDTGFAGDLLYSIAVGF